MKEIKAIIRPAKLLAVTEELHGIEWLPGVTVLEIKGFGRRRSKNGPEGGSGLVEMITRYQLEVVVDDDKADEIVDLIQNLAHTGNTGDGKIFVTTIDEVVKIRTNERGPKAL